jgi:hypothetical protein
VLALTVRRRGFLLAVLSIAAISNPAASGEPDDFLSWPGPLAESIGASMRSTGRVGGVFDLRVRSRNRAYNYKLRATWLTPDVIRASARLEQLRSHLANEETRRLVSDAESVADTVVLVEIDPREGSGVIPATWIAFLQPKGLPEGDSRAVRGLEVPGLRNLPGLRGAAKRDYAYDQFWVTFPLTNREGSALFSGADQQAELIVRIHEKEGRAVWTIPASIRGRLRAIASPP